MAIRAVIFDIGGILEIIPAGGDPTEQFPQMLARWDARLGQPEGTLRARFDGIGERLRAGGKDGETGTWTEEELRRDVRAITGLDQAGVDAFMRDHWDIYCGNPNPELAAYFGALRPRYRTALLSNSFDGARREEEARYAFSALTDQVIYSHEEGIAKPDPRVYQVACARVAAQPDEVVFLDDAERNVAAARALGIHGVLYRDNAQAMSEIEALLRAFPD